MDRLQIGANRLGISLSSRQLEQFELYYRELIDWNERINLTSITGYEEAQAGHFLDSLTAISGIAPPLKAVPLKIIDIGTGAGLPGIPLKIVLPQISLTLLEATAKKTKFLYHIVEKLGLDKVYIITGRAEEIAHNAEYREKFDLVLARAVASLPALVEIALPFCTTGGSFIAQKKGDIDSEVKQSSKAIDIMGGRLREIKPIVMEEFKDNRALVVIDKVKPTPPNYPRRPGMPEKRPLIS